jgi:alpha-1,3-rhamnosyl/mannosyltransferase
VRVAFDVGIQARRNPLGTERGQATLLAALAQRGGHELLLFSPEPVPAALDALAEEVDGTSSQPLALWRETALPELLRRHRADVLHSPVAAIPLRTSCPRLATIHDLPWVRYRRRVEGRGPDRDAWHLNHRARTALAARHAARLLCVSRRTGDDLLAAHPACADRIRVVPHGVDPRFTPAGSDTPGRPDVLASLGLPDAPFLLAVGALRHRKNLSTLVEAFASTPALAGHRLLLAGPADEAHGAVRERASARALGGRVHVTGFVGDDALVDLYRRADVVVHPAAQEGFGLPVLEAMACGTPVVCCAQGAAEEARGDAALTFELGGGPAALGARLVEAVAGSTRDDRVRRGLQHAAELSAAALAARMDAVYGELS